MKRRESVMGNPPVTESRPSLRAADSPFWSSLRGRMAANRPLEHFIGADDDVYVEEEPPAGRSASKKKTPTSRRFSLRTGEIGGHLPCKFFLANTAVVAMATAIEPVISVNSFQFISVRMNMIFRPYATSQLIDNTSNNNNVS